MAAIVLLIASFIFLVDAAFMFGKVNPKGAATANAIVGSLMAVLGLWLSGTARDGATLIVAGLTMAFSMFYLILAWDLFGEHDLTGLGYYCLGAGLYVALTSYFYFSIGDLRFGIFALSWAVLFLAAFASMALKLAWGKFIGWLLAIEGVITLLIPAFLIMAGKW
ncbi:AmiS/UreI family transporter [Moorella sulfitireducens (nom. illeg.)]|uniref:AmiS/UreI family transporter n=1 Tax=Neomoorella sulfitireducens TaxID=2972948 RepID=UPI0021ACE065|nr:AmiS/UreI family transporter [Moorella sulfitireducens]